LKGNDYFCISLALRTEDKNSLPATGQHKAIAKESGYSVMNFDGI